MNRPAGISMSFPSLPVLLALLVSVPVAPAARAGEAVGLAVRVTEPGGKPVEGARVHLFAAEGPAFATSATGSDGIAHFPRLARRPECVLVTARHRTPVVLEAAESAREMRATLPEARRLRLRIVDGATGRPVPGADLVLFPDYEACRDQAWIGITASRRVHVELDREREDGTVEVRDAPAGQASALVVSPGHGLALVRLGPGDPVEVELDGSACRSVRVVEEGTDRPVEGVRIVPGRMLAILGHAGADLPAARGMLAAFGALGTTGEDGRVVVCPPPGAPARFGAIAEGRLPFLFDFPTGDRSEVLVRLPATATLEARVFDEVTGTPLPGIHVVLEGPGFEDRGITGGDGALVREGIPARRPVRVRVVTPDGAEELAALDVPGLGPGARETVRLYVAPSLRLVVEEAGGRPLPATPVLLLRPGRDGEASSILAEDATGADGAVTFYLPGAPPADTLVVVRRDACLVVRELPPPADEDDALAPRPVVLGGREVSLRVLAEGTEDPVRGAVVRCLVAGGQPSPARLDLRRGTGPLQLGTDAVRYVPGDPGLLALAGAGGRIEFRLPASCDGLLVEGPVDERARYGRASLTADELEDGEGTTLDVLLPRQAGVTVRPSFAGPAPARVAFLVRPLDGSAGGRVFGGPPVPRDIPLPGDGPWVIVVRADGYAPAVLGPLAGEESWPELDATLEYGGFVRVELPPGAAGDRATLVDEAGIDWWEFAGHAVRDEDGTAVLDLGPLPVGRWRLEVDGGRCAAEVRIRATGEQAEARCE